MIRLLLVTVTASLIAGQAALAQTVKREYGDWEVTVKLNPMDDDTTASATTRTGPEGRHWLTVACVDGELTILLRTVPNVTPRSGGETTVQYRVDAQDPFAPRAWTAAAGQWVAPPGKYPRSLLDKMLTGGTVLFQVGSEGTVDASFSLDGLSRAWQDIVQVSPECR